jgi:uncharacterized protein
MKTRDADILIIPGLGGSGADHWQTRWEAKLATARRVAQRDWDRPVLADWLPTIRETIDRAERPVILVAHSLGVIAAARAIEQAATTRVAGAFLVAPPSETTIEGLPEIARDFSPYPRRVLACPSVVVGSTDDPYATLADTEALAAAWGSVFHNAGAAGHINADSGHGPWPEGLMSFAGFLSKL